MRRWHDQKMLDAYIAFTIPADLCAISRQATSGQHSIFSSQITVNPAHPSNRVTPSLQPSSTSAVVSNGSSAADENPIHMQADAQPALHQLHTYAEYVRMYPYHVEQSLLRADLPLFSVSSIFYFFSQ